MIAPDSVSSRWNVSVSIFGITVSYICQNAQMDKNARPTSTVRLLSSFMACLLFEPFSQQDTTPAGK